ncbi:GNAT family N-acetyltransferase [Plantactinospora sp. KBS50]|nr:GNAT family N-acetyltransferase [Plantactinospora sp. KBS50]
MPLDPRDDEAVTQAYRIRRASASATVADLPPRGRREVAAGIRQPMPGQQVRALLAVVGGTPVGFATLHLPMLDNTGNAELDIAVHPDHLRRGVGRALHGYAVRLARELGRKRIVGEVVSGLPDGPPRDPAGSAFAAAMGATAVLDEVRRRLDVGTVDWPALDAAYAAGRRRAAGYSTICWAGLTEPGHLADIAYLNSRLMADAPIGDLVWEQENIDVTRQEAEERLLVDRGRRLYSAAARDDATGRLVGFTRIMFAATDAWHAYQQITLVDPEHRGHRLGAAVKIDNLRYTLTHEPELCVVDTWNATDNEQMISINELLGYRPLDIWQAWQLTL